MKARLIPYDVAPGALKPMIELEKTLKNSGLELKLIELVKTRASQINGCAYCIHMHTKDARANDVRGQRVSAVDRLYLLSAWRESPLYSDRERAALAWTEALTLVAETHAPDGDYAELTRHFTPVEQVNLTLLIGAINAWNRLAIGFRSVHPVEAGRAAA